MAKHNQCLYCGIEYAVVVKVRNRDGYTLGCGLEYNSEGGEYYEELSPQHRWSPWPDKFLASMGILPEKFEKYRLEPYLSMGYAPCEDKIHGHSTAEQDDEEFNMKTGHCWRCGKVITEEEDVD